MKLDNLKSAINAYRDKSGRIRGVPLALQKKCLDLGRNLGDKKASLQLGLGGSTISVWRSKFRPAVGDQQEFVAIPLADLHQKNTQNKIMEVEIKGPSSRSLVVRGQSFDMEFVRSLCQTLLVEEASR